MNSTKHFLRDTWRLAKPYWFSEDRWRGRGLLFVIVSMSLGLVYINVLLNKWNNAFYDTLQNRDWPGFVHQLGVFCILAFVYIAVAVYQLYLQQMLQIRWRRWLTERYLERWLGGRAYYMLQMHGGETDNPDQRIADDIDGFVSQTLSLTLGFLESAVTLVSFVGILWGLSGAISFSLAGVGVTVPGYMVWIALVYAAVGSWLTMRVGRPLIGLNFAQQRYEADFRFSLVRFRENVEGVALYGGEKDEAKIFGSRFAHVVDNWWAIMKRRKRLAWLTNGYAQVAIIFPILAAAPRYFSGAMQLGGLMQTASAFGQVQGALSWFVDAYTELASWRATVERLTGFTRDIEAAHRVRAGEGPARGENGDNALRVENLSLDLPDGAPLLRGVNLDLRPGERLLVSGPSGAGKSTLFRAIAGLWPYGGGSILLPSGGRTLFLPQKPYLPVGDLRTVLGYPAPPGGFSDDELRAALADCGLARLADRLDDASYWAQRLSPGEQQRLAFARMLLQKPDWLFMDESTSALDEAGEAELYALLRERLPDTAVISVGHRSSLMPFHERRITVAEYAPAR
ncbi:ABC transporter ATP-binding protein/permease [Pseudodesulfovibrio sp.]|uniref:ABC transporter ATP-binding protein/permease n=1 Tax=Pseudodesulfovibrio sp. TaxID=2035812 RepID=UPI002602BD17|nr:ABC transporter ATP-binding protein/permease [Pseudodesulfovibrio sp.]MDD3311872.1 ABC transporter ATP-binding protein/permease [Pseudodesulfovibrio sp.]